MHTLFSQGYGKDNRSTESSVPVSTIEEAGELVTERDPAGEPPRLALPSVCRIRLIGPFLKLECSEFTIIDRFKRSTA